jgi:hypothetical protein
MRDSHVERGILQGVKGRFAVMVTLIGIATANLPVQAQSYQVLHTFTHSPDGARPYAGLVHDAAG